MLYIPDDFFKEEERLGFLIPEIMKRGWAIQLNLLDTMMTIAKKHGIKFWVDYGTLLGAVRHNGFIPWDDDIDICIMRNDYMKFIHILQDELPSHCSVYSFYTSQNYDQPKAFIANRRHFDIGNDVYESELTKQQYNCPYASGIDMNPMDYVPKDDGQLQLIGNLYSSAYDLANRFDIYNATGELEEYLTQLEELLATHLTRDEHLRSSIWKLADAIAMMTTKEEADGIIWYAEIAVRGFNVKRKLESYSETRYYDFEMLKVPVPVGYDEVLRTPYGNNYMTPVQAGSGHEYPFYKFQDKQIVFYNKFGQIGDVF